MSINPLNTTELDQTLKNSSVTKGSYLGAYPSCTKPKTKKKMYSFISNTGEHHETGQHWCAWVVIGNKISFFDSFGREPWDSTFPTHFQEIVADFRYVQYTKTRIQDWNSKTCGYFCLHFIYVLCLGLDYEHFLSEYSKKYLYNDYVTFDFLNSIV